jgi:methylenetetrahydrofolate dehydrogenase (NADP+)/methenyltetrahydrofolate cyclohydrolase
MAQLLTGKEVAQAITEKLKADVEALKAKGVTPTLGVIRVGEREDDISYEKGVTKRCAAIGTGVKSYVLPENATTEQLLATVREANEDKGVHGILLFRPLPKHINDEAIRAALAPAKDIDGITDGSFAGVYANLPDHGYPPCTAESCVKILEHYGIDPAGKRVVVAGRSLVVGRPAALMLMHRNATVTVCHSKTPDLPGVCREADIVIAAIGKAKFFKANFFKSGQIVVDVGIHVGEDGKMCGDVDFADAEPIVGAITPVPGGVGSVTTCLTLRHMVDAAIRATGA